MFDAMERFLSSVLETAVFAGTVFVLVCAVGLLLFHLVGAGKVGTLLFLSFPAKVLGGVLKLGGKGAAKLVGRAIFEFADFKARVERAPDPEAPLVRFEERRPMELPGADAGVRPKLEHGDWHVFAKTYKEAVHMLMMGAPGAGKDQAGVLPMLMHLLVYSDEHLVIVDPKRELRKLLSPYLRPDDRVFAYSFTKKTRTSSSLSLAFDEEDVADVAAFLIPPEGRETHWAKSAQLLFVRVEDALFREYGRRPTVLEIFDATEDPDRFDELCERYPNVKRVTPNEKEFGSIYSTALTALGQLRWPRVRRVFAGGTEMPFGPGGRSVVFVEPDVGAGERLERYVALVVHQLYELAAEDGDPDGDGSKRGTKVVVDEAASFMRLEKIPHYLDIGRGSRVQLAYVLQNWPQLRDVIGQDKAKRAWGSTEFRIVGAGTDPETAQEISKLSGKQRVTFAGPRQRNWERRREQIVRPVIAPEHITGLKKSKGASEWAVTLGPTVELVRVRKPDQFFFRRALPPDPDWELMPVLGSSGPTEEPGPDDHGPRRTTPPEEGPFDGGPVYDNVTELRDYRKPPRRRPRETDAKPEEANPGGAGEPTEEEPNRCANCGGENPPGRKACRRCRRPLAAPQGGAGG